MALLGAPCGGLGQCLSIVYERCCDKRHVDFDDVIIRIL